MILPYRFELRQNYPNPFNPATRIEFSLPKSEIVTLKVFNIIGKEVSTLVDKRLPAGNHIFTFDGGHMASGVYLYSINAGMYSDVKRMVILK
jgi:hypothetical protein